MGRNAFGQLYHDPRRRSASRLTRGVLRWIERHATRRRGPSARAAVRYLSRGMVTGRSYRDAQPVLRILYAAHDPRVAALARESLDRAWSAGPLARSCVWEGIWMPTGDDGTDRYRSARVTVPPPPAAVDFLLTAVPTARHHPATRLVAGLDGDDAWGTEARSVVEAAVDHGDRRLAALLAGTDQPDLLAAIESASVDALRFADPPLWTDGPLLTLLRRNPRLPRPPDEAADATAAALLAVFMDRFDLLRPDDGWQLFYRTKDILKRNPPADVAARFRRALRLPGPMTDVIRVSAMRGDAEALAAWEDSGGQASDPHWRAAHLFWTRDWAGYDRLDPDGRLLREFLRGPRYADPRRAEAVSIAGRFRAIAGEEGRPDPSPPPPPPPPSEAGDTGRHVGGSWPTGYTGGHF